MTWIITKVLIAASVISFASWLAQTKVGLAGFVMALPLSSMLALAFFNIEYRDPAKSVTFAQAILVSVPLSLTFFIPFLFAEKIKLPFWGLYGVGVLFLFISYLVQSHFFGNSR